MRININGTWAPLDSLFPAGGLMLRAVVGSETPPPTATSTHQSFEENAPIQIWPNPTTGILQLQLNDYTDFAAFRYSLSSQLGKTLKNGPLAPEIDLTDLPSGLYFLSVLNSNGYLIWTEKVTVVK